MPTFRTNAHIVGVLFILGTITGVIVISMTVPILATPDYLTRIAANEGRMALAAFLYFAMAIACVGIGLALYPIVKTYDEGLAIGAAGFRIIEGTIQVSGAAGLVCLLALSRASIQAGAENGAVFQAIGTVIQTGSDWLANGPMILSWCIAALMYYAVFYRFNLVPRWLSGWGLAGIMLTLLAGGLGMLGLFSPSETLHTAINMPIAIQEMVFAVWLIVKGIRPTGIPRQAAISGDALAQGAIS